MLMYEIRLFEIVKRKLEYIENSDIYKNRDLIYVKEGEIKAYNEILADIEVKEEQEYVEKYLNILRELNKKFEMIDYEAKTNDIEQERLTGYNNAIVSVLTLLNPKYEFELE